MAEKEVVELPQLHWGPLGPQPRDVVVAEIQHGGVDGQTGWD